MLAERILEHFGTGGRQGLGLDPGLKVVLVWGHLCRGYALLKVLKLLVGEQGTVSGVLLSLLLMRALVLIHL